MTITPDPKQMSPEAEAGIVLVYDTPFLALRLSQVREQQQPVSVAYLSNQLMIIAARILRTGRPAHCQEAAAVWAASELDALTEAAQEIIDAALAAGQPEGSA